jgi:hypothetical protein
MRTENMIADFPYFAMVGVITIAPAPTAITVRVATMYSWKRASF